MTDITELRIVYKNWRGEVAERKIRPLGSLVFGKTEYHPEPQWLLPAIDLDKGEERTFALKDIQAFL